MPWSGGGGGGAAYKYSTPTQDNKNMAALVTSGDEDKATNSTVAHTPVEDGYVAVYLNGNKGVPVGDGDKTKDCYFSGNGGTTARTISDIASGDTLHWMGSIAGYELDATDYFDFEYDVDVP